MIIFGLEITKANGYSVRQALRKMKKEEILRNHMNKITAIKELRNLCGRKKDETGQVYYKLGLKNAKDIIENYAFKHNLEFYYS